MFWHNFKYITKVLTKNRMLLFWTYAFPIILGTFFYMAFSDIEESESLDIINIAVIESDELKENAYFKEAIDSLSEEGEDQLFNTTYTSLDEAKSLLEEDEISGYIELTPEAKLTINSNGINETVIHTVIDEIESTSTTVQHLYESLLQNGEDIMTIETKVDEILENSKKETLKIVDTSNASMSYTMIEYYTLISMTCLYGGIIGMTVVSYVNAKTDKGKRVSVAPTKKSTLILSGLLSSYIAELIGLAILYLFTIFVLHVDYGTYLKEIVYLSLAGSFAGLTLGICIGSVLKTSENTKMGMMIALTMLGCFFSGMMGITMKYIIDTNVPIINLINPASMITDGLYSLYYYGVSDRYYFDLISLLIFSALLIIISINSLRRVKYDSL